MAEMPGEVLVRKFMTPLGVSQYQLAKAIGRPQATISNIVLGKHRISYEIALLLGKAFDTPAKYWVDLDFDYWRSTLEKEPKVKPLYEKSFVERVHEANPDAVMLGEYVDSNTKIPMRCKKCGREWLAYPRNLLDGSGCLYCRTVQRAASKKEDPEKEDTE